MESHPVGLDTGRGAEEAVLIIDVFPPDDFYCNSETGNSRQLQLIRHLF